MSESDVQEHLPLGRPTSLTRIHRILYLNLILVCVNFVQGQARSLASVACSLFRTAGTFHPLLFSADGTWTFPDNPSNPTDALIDT